MTIPEQREINRKLAAGLTAGLFRPRFRTCTPEEMAEADAEAKRLEDEHYARLSLKPTIGRLNGGFWLFRGNGEILAGPYQTNDAAEARAEEFYLEEVK